MQRLPAEIIADYLHMFVGDDSPDDKFLPNAEIILRWLADEGWQVFAMTTNERRAHVGET